MSIFSNTIFKFPLLPNLILSIIYFIDVNILSSKIQKMFDLKSFVDNLNNFKTYVNTNFIALISSISFFIYTYLSGKKKYLELFDLLIILLFNFVIDYLYNLFI